MKHLPLIKDIVFTIAILALFGLYIKNHPTGKSAPEAQSISDTTYRQHARNKDIAIINLDTLLNGYDLYQEKYNNLEQETRRMESQFSQDQNKLQQRLEDLQQKANKRLITTADYENQYNQLIQDGSQLQQKGQELSMMLAEKEQVMINNIMHQITTHLETIQEKYDYRVVLGKSGSSAILYGDPALDITKDVLEGLNKAHQANKKK